MFRSIAILLCACALLLGLRGASAEPSTEDRAALAHAYHTLHREDGTPRPLPEITPNLLERVVAELAPVYRRERSAEYGEGTLRASAAQMIDTATLWWMARAPTAGEKARAAEAGLRALAPEHEMEVSWSSYGFTLHCREALVAAHALRPDEIAVAAEWKWLDRRDMVRQDSRGRWCIREDLLREWTGKSAPSAPTLVDSRSGKRFLRIEALPKELISVDHYDTATQTLTLTVPPLRASDPHPGA